MKKLGIIAISALVMGASSTSFAAFNPFSDVPSDHWSFKAVAQLADEGIIGGYNDGTFKGDTHITRYEMAQMVAKAMAKEDVSIADKALISKLSVEYADELKNLGVRVTNLEEQADNVKISGLLRIDRIEEDVDKRVGSKDKASTFTANLRLEMMATVNDSWTVKTRMDTNANLKNGAGDNRTKLEQAWAEGPLAGATAKLGRLGTFQGENLAGGGMIIDTDINGAELTWTGKDLKTILTYGRLPDGNYKAATMVGNGDQFAPYRRNGRNADYAALQVVYDPTDRWGLGAGYFNLHRDQGFSSGEVNGINDFKNDNQIWNIGANYKLNKNLSFGAIYAQSNLAADTGSLAYGADNAERTAYSLELKYGNARPSMAGSYRAWIAYRQIGSFASINSTYAGVPYGQKGFEAGIEYIMAKNMMAELVVFDGERISPSKSDSKDVQRLFTRIDITF